MSMFDYVRVCVPLPDGYVPSREDNFQTKDFDCSLTTVWMREDGRLLIEDFEYEDVPKEERPYPNDTGIKGIFGCLRKINLRWRDLEFHGWFVFYDYVDGVSHEYKAKYTDGKLMEIVAIR